MICKLEVYKKDCDLTPVNKSIKSFKIWKHCDSLSSAFQCRFVERPWIWRSLFSCSDIVCNRSLFTFTANPI